MNLLLKLLLATHTFHMSRHYHILNASLLHFQHYQLSYRASILTNRNPSRPLNLSMIASIFSTFFGSCILSIARTFSLASFGLIFYIFSVTTSLRCVGFTIPLAQNLEFYFEAFEPCVLWDLQRKKLFWRCGVVTWGQLPLIPSRQSVWSIYQSHA